MSYVGPLVKTKAAHRAKFAVWKGMNSRESNLSKNYVDSQHT